MRRNFVTFCSHYASPFIGKVSPSTLWVTWLTHESGIELSLAETVFQHSEEDASTLTAVYDSGHTFMSSVALAWLAFNKKWVYLHLIRDIWGVGPEELFFLEPGSFEAFKRYGMQDTRDFGLWYVEQRFEEDDVVQLAVNNV